MTFQKNKISGNKGAVIFGLVPFTVLTVKVRRYTVIKSWNRKTVIPGFVFFFMKIFNALFKLDLYEEKEKKD